MVSFYTNNGLLYLSNQRLGSLEDAKTHLALFKRASLITDSQSQEKYPYRHSTIIATKRGKTCLGERVMILVLVLLLVGKNRGTSFFLLCLPPPPTSSNFANPTPPFLIIIAQPLITKRLRASIKFVTSRGICVLSWGPSKYILSCYPLNIH